MYLLLDPNQIIYIARRYWTISEKIKYIHLVHDNCHYLILIKYIQCTTDSSKSSGPGKIVQINRSSNYPKFYDFYSIPKSTIPISVVSNNWYQISSVNNGIQKKAFWWITKVPWCLMLAKTRCPLFFCHSPLC